MKQTLKNKLDSHMCRLGDRKVNRKILEITEKLDHAQTAASNAAEAPNTADN